MESESPKDDKLNGKVLSYRVAVKRMAKMLLQLAMSGSLRDADIVFLEEYIRHGR